MLEYDLDIRPTKLVKGKGLEKLMVQSNCEVLGMIFLALCSENIAQVEEKQVHPDFIVSSSYKDIIYILQKLQAPLGMSKTQEIFVKLNAAKYCIIDEYLYWKDPGGVLLNFLLEEEAKEKMQEFHKGDCCGHLYWKGTAHKILRAGFYWPAFFSDTYK